LTTKLVNRPNGRDHQLSVNYSPLLARFWVGTRCAFPCWEVEMLRMLRASLVPRSAPQTTEEEQEQDRTHKRACAPVFEQKHNMPTMAEQEQVQSGAFQAHGFSGNTRSKQTSAHKHRAKRNTQHTNRENLSVALSSRSPKELAVRVSFLGIHFLRTITHFPIRNAASQACAGKDWVKRRSAFFGPKRSQTRSPFFG
jgi:hypothetical protein